MCQLVFFFFFKQKTAYEMRISDWSSDVCSSDLFQHIFHGYQAGNSAMFVDHDGQMIAAAAEVVQQHIQAFGFRNEYGGTHERAQVDGRIGDGKQEVLGQRSEEHTSELQSLMRISYAVFCLKKNTNTHKNKHNSVHMQA